MANIAFNGILVQNLLSDFVSAPPSELVFVAAIVATTVSIGFASYLLRKNPELSGFSELKSFLANPPRAFLAYLAVVTGWCTSGFLLQPWRLDQSQNESAMYHFSFEPWYLVLSSLLLGAFLAMPVTNLYRQSSKVSDCKAARSLKIISFSWGGFGAVSLLQVAVPASQGLGEVAEGLLFLSVAFALREPSILSRIISDQYSERNLQSTHSLGPKHEAFDPVSRRDDFSTLLRLDHNTIANRRILLEFDPCAAYEDIVGGFVEEFQSNKATVAVFTSVGSPVHRRLGNQLVSNLFSFSSKTSTPSRRSEREVLLPERESSLLLDAVDRLLQANRGRQVSIVFDIFSDLALLQGFEKAYSVLSSVLEMVESDSATTLVLLNQAAHDERVLSGVRGLFVSQVICKLDGVRLVRFQHADVHERFDQTDLFSEPVDRGVGTS